MNQSSIPRPVEILMGFDAIGQPFGAGAKQVKRWLVEGAPIYRDSRGIPRAEKAELWAWYAGRFATAAAPRAGHRG